jgi:hypothetical protein
MPSMYDLSTPNRRLPLIIRLIRLQSTSSLCHASWELLCATPDDLSQFRLKHSIAVQRLTCHGATLCKSSPKQGRPMGLLEGQGLHSSAQSPFLQRTHIMGRVLA